MALRLRRVLVGFVLFILVLVLALWWGSWLAVSLNAAKIATAIELQLGPGFEVGEVTGDLFRGLELKGVAAGPDPAQDPDGAPILQAATCLLLPDHLALLQGTGAIREIQFHDVNLTLRRSADGAMLWPPFIARAATAQGASWNLSAFRWVLHRAQVDYHPLVGSKAVRTQIPLARGSFSPNEDFRIEQCRGTLGDASWELAITLNQQAKSLNGLLRLKEAGIWTLTQAFTSHRTQSLDAAALPTGLLSGALNIGGTLTDPVLSGRVDWRDGSLRHFRVEQGDLRLKWRPGLLELEEGVAKAYNGRLAATGKIDFRTAPPRYHFEASTEQMQLGQYLEDAGFGKIRLSGNFAGSIIGDGSLAAVDSLTASGQVAARDGETLNPLYDPQVSGSQQVITYSTLATAFTIRRSRLMLSEAEMTATDLKMAGTGQVAFDGALNLAGTLVAPGRQFASHPQFGPAVDFLDLHDEPIGLRLTVLGTLERPEVAATVDPATIQQAAKQGLFGKLRDLLRGSNSGSPGNE